MNGNVSRFFSQVHPPFKDIPAVQTEKSHGKMESAEEIEAPGEKWLPWLWHPPRSDHRSHHGLWWWPRPGHGGLWQFGSAAFWRIFWYVGFACVGSFLGLFCYLLWSSTPQTHLLILWCRLANLNSVKTLKRSKTTHKRRNKGINRITIHFNPLNDS